MTSRECNFHKRLHMHNNNTTLKQKVWIRQYTPVSVQLTVQYINKNSLSVKGEVQSYSKEAQ